MSTWNEKTKVGFLFGHMYDEDTFDLYETTSETLGVAYVGGLRLTGEGMDHFAEVLDLPVLLDTKLHIGVVDVRAGLANDYESLSLKEYTAKLKYMISLLGTLFWGAAGYCREEDWKKWFYQVDEDDNPVEEEDF